MAWQLRRSRCRNRADLAWQRYLMAWEAGETKLAAYLVRFLAPSDQKLAARFKAMRSRPTGVQRIDATTLEQPKIRRLFAYGIKRLARKDAGAAHALLLERHTSSAFIRRQKRTLGLCR